MTLRERAERATPGPWTAESYMGRPDLEFGADLRGPNGETITYGGSEGLDASVPDAANARYLESVSPDAILALLDRIEALEGDRERLRAALRREHDFAHALGHDGTTALCLEVHALLDETDAALRDTAP